MIEIPLKGGLVALVDDCDADLAEMKWRPKRHGNNHYAYRSVGNKTIWLHRAVMERVLKRLLLTSEGIDHIHHDGLDNRRSELRLANQSQNIANARLSKKNTSGYRGVSWNKESQKWNAKIRVSYKLIDLGFFTCPIKAARAYNTAALAYFGDFAYQNPIEGEGGAR